MWGLMIALVYATAVYFLGQPNTFPEVFLSATNFLLWWYIITSIILGVIVVLLSLGIWGGGTVWGASEGGFLGGLLGFLGGGVLSALILVLFAIGTACAIGGTYLLHHSLTVTPAGLAEWDTPKLVFGAVLLVISLIMGKSSSFSSSKS